MVSSFPWRRTSKRILRSISCGLCTKEHVLAVTLDASPFDVLQPVDVTRLWRRHLAWSKRDGNTLRDRVVQSYASKSVFVSLLLASNITVMFSPSTPAEVMRTHLKAQEYNEVGFWTGVFIYASIIMCLCTLLSTFTAWSIISSVSGRNAKSILRSSIGLQISVMPYKLSRHATNTFTIWTTLFMFDLLPWNWAVSFTVVAWCLIVHIVSSLNALGRLVMLTSAMSTDQSIFEDEEANSMMPEELSLALVRKAKETKHNQMTLSEEELVSTQYRTTSAQPHSRCVGVNTL